MDSIVISLGGSVVLSENSDASFFSKLTDLIKDLSKSFKIYLIIGGGKNARFYINLARNLGSSEEKLDQLGIQATRLNAFFLAQQLSKNQPFIPETTDEAINLELPVIIMGGTTPGHSTDYVGAEIAAKTKAKYYLIATNVDGVYTKDPRKYPDAKQLTSINIDTLLDQYGNSWKSAGKNMVIDGPALQLIKDNQIHTFVIDGGDLDQYKNIIENKPFKGTTIQL